MLSRDPRVFTIPPGAAFLPTLADALTGGRILDGFGCDPAALAEATIYLPTRRAARAFAALLAAQGDGRAQLLPRIVPLGEADDAEFELAGSAADDPAFEGAEALAPPIATLERRLILTGLIQHWAETVDRARLKLGDGAPLLVPASPADAVGFAGDLERLMDGFATEDIPWDQLAEAVETDYSEYFGLTLDFVRIAAENWPKILAERGASDPARRRSALIHAEARRLLAEQPERPFIAAGSTGSMPATAALLNAIARLPHGAVVLPGLDTDLDEPSWTAIGGLETEHSDPVHGHPQAMLRRLLEEHLRLPRAAVRTLGSPPDGAAARCRMLSEALRPADTTDGWAEMDAEIRADLSRRGCAGIKLVDAADEREEALAAAIALRETLVAPGRTAALVTPDRALAKRVAAELARWGIAVEDSAGVPLSETPAGVAARLAADAAALDFHPIRVLALLAHPLVCLGRPRAVIERAASALEIGILRGPAPAPGADGLRQAFARGRNVLAWHAPRAKKRLTDEDWRLAADLVEWLAAAFDGFTPEAFGEHETDLVMIAEAHRRMLDVLLDDPNEESSEADDDSRQHLAALFDDLALTKARHVEGTFSDYPSFFTALARERVASSPARATHRRIKILGLLEARLLAVDRVVLGGLDEGVWPPRAETDAFLNRPMRSRVGLSPPERRIGQTAHDFVQALGMKDVVITRARKRGGSPMVPSRFLQRIKAFADDGIWGGMVEAGRRYLDLARVLDTPKPVPPLLRPAPKPDAGLFPRSLSVTEIETLVRDPYAIFARHILKLDPLDPLAALPGAAERGTVIHDILKDFAAAHPREMPPDASADLMERGLNAFARIADAFPDLYAQWWPRFERLVPAFLKWEEERRRDAAVIHPERSGSLPLPLPDGSVFTLRARADRIEQRPGGGFAIVDFKTGAPPSNKVVAIGFSPQMTLEAAMLMRGAFKDLPAAQETPELVYVRVAGGQKPLEPRPVEQPRDDPRAIATIVEDHLAGLTALVARYMGGDAAFLSRPYAQYARRLSDYDHLARVKEWSVTSGTASEGGAE